MSWPPDILELEQVVDRMVTRGGACVPVKWRGFLLAVGVANSANDDQWMWPTQNFLRYALPARDKSDLLRRVLIRDSRYRLHVDLCICSVIHSVAIAERWSRLEEIVFRACHPLMPRVAQLLLWRCEATGRSPRDLTSRDWAQASLQYGDEVFLAWDQQLWGECRNAVDLFPLLMDLYVPLTSQPFFVLPDNADCYALVASLIKAARDGEGIIISETHRQQLTELQDAGLPIRFERRVNGTLTAHAVGAVTSVAVPWEMVGEPCDVTTGIPSSARQSCLVSEADSPTMSPVEITDRRSHLAIVSLEQDIERWPSADLSDAPEWLPVPGAEVLASAAKRRSDSQNADLALNQLAKHPLYGFLLQLFLLEALDRELGEETLAFALPQNRKLDTPDAWAETQVFYRPRMQTSEAGDEGLKGFSVLGSLDEVLPTIAHESGIDGIASPYTGDGTAWSRAVYLLSTAGVIDGRPDRWTLTITTFILDRFHAGTLMKDFIRGGRAVRDQMHSVLLTLWKEKTKAAVQEPILV